MNTVNIIGNLTRDPEVRHLTSGTSVCKLTIANNRKYKKKDGELVEETLFVDVELWGAQADNAGRHLQKGARVGITGRLKMDTWETNDGQKRSKLSIFADSVDYLSGAEGPSTSDAPKTQARKSAARPQAQTHNEESSDYSEEEAPW